MPTNQLFPMLALFNLGGAEIIVILILVGLIGLAVIGAIVFFVIQASRQKPPSAQPFTTTPPPFVNPPRDLEQELRVLAKLKNEGLITEEDFNQKKKTLLGI